MLGDRERRQASPPTRPGRLVHLPEYQCGTLQHTGLPELEQQLMPFARAFADPGKDRNTGVTLDRRADQLHDQHGLTDPGAAEHCGLAAGDQRRQQIDDLDAGMEDLARAALTSQRRRGSVNWATLDLGAKRRPPVDGVPERVKEAAEHLLTDRDGDRHAERPCRRPALQAGSRAKRYRPHPVGADMLPHFHTSVGPRSQSTAIASSIAGSLPSGKVKSTTEP